MTDLVPVAVGGDVSGSALVGADVSGPAPVLDGVVVIARLGVAGADEGDGPAGDGPDGAGDTAGAGGDVPGPGSAGRIGAGSEGPVSSVNPSATPAAAVVIAIAVAAHHPRRTGARAVAIVGGGSNRSRSAVICPARAVSALRNLRSTSSVTAPPVARAGSTAPGAPST
ncbi:hypothetical protein FHR83_001302 [Actinoplanes campanulatus]|uniref:Uncharacterized protein n=1 Tax=Actinoplanes campanulatus TaxID=113559 RepID=A0A7W5FCQ1_9ACTN|nr:hypothetical protein [Actinoplanes campanulatus]MBB3093653.1 hypothetical protein [Actinoplanes campanulatus]GGN04821.1 hypothetical protein GCM10010109_11740 [Actinoplanes campanulatus]GID35270.1 hypothetical protein Aca09nite_17760 [Actinoplanes campanulatus]